MLVWNESDDLKYNINLLWKTNVIADEKFLSETWSINDENKI